jgi:L-iditol 2-dehydrogenase
MKASYIYGARDIRIQEISDSAPEPGQVLLDVTAVGVCGSDLHAYLLGNVGGVVPEGPLTLGHEAAGVVLALGEGVEGLHVGQRVAIDPAKPCNVCERCQHGEPHLCLNLEFLGTTPYHGALRERMVHPAHCCIPVPDSISMAGTALLEPLGVAIHANRLGKLQIGEDVAVLGCGAIGLLLIRLARLGGARRIFAVDRHPWRLALAEAYGAEFVLDARAVDPVAEVLRVTGKRGVDVAWEAAWAAETVDQCVDMVRFGGRVVIVGIPAEDEMKLKASGARRKEVMIQPSRRMKHVYETAIALTERGQIDLDRLATHTFPLEQTGQAFETAATYGDGVVRAVILPNADKYPNALK